MANEPILTLVGNLTADPELRYTPNGAAVANFTVAQTPKSFDKSRNEYVDGETVFMRCNVWREAAENVANTLGKGMRVVVTGRLKSRSFEDKQGNRRTVMELEVDEVGPSLRYATAAVSKTPRQEQVQGVQGSPARSQGWGEQPQHQDPWAGSAAGDGVPF